MRKLLLAVLILAGCPGVEPMVVADSVDSEPDVMVPEEDTPRAVVDDAGWVEVTVEEDGGAAGEDAAADSGAEEAAAAVPDEPEIVVEPEPTPEPTPEPEQSGAEEDDGASVPEPFAVLEDKILSGQDLTDEELVAMTPGELRLLRNTIFAQHGRTFSTPVLAEHFAARAAADFDDGWYEVDPDYSDEKLRPVDHLNAERILRAEGRGRDAQFQTEQAVAKQVEGLSASAGRLRVLDAYLTDKMAVEDGEAPEGFELQPLEDYKDQGVEEPRTKRKSVARGE